MSANGIALETCTELTLAQENEMYAALRAVEDRLWTFAEVKARCRMVGIAGQPGKETFFIDGRAALEFYPATTEIEYHGERATIRTTRRFRKLYKTE